MGKNKPLSSFGLPGAGIETRSFRTATDAVREIRRAHAKGFPVIPAGHGTNCAFLEAMVPAVFLRSANTSVRTMKKGKTVMLTVGAGLGWDDLVRHAVKSGWRGIEQLSGIPGTCGAAPVQNIGAYGASLADVIESVRCVNLKTLRIVKLSRADCGFGYRTSIFNTSRRGEFLIVSMTLRLLVGGPVSVSDHGELRNRLPAHPSLFQIRKAVLAIRKRKLPDWKTLPNCGSFFKNPIVGKEIGNAFMKKNPDAPYWLEGKSKMKLSAAWLIEQSGARNKHWGKIALSPQHALVLVNRGEKNHKRLQNAIGSIVSGVKKKFGVILKPEPNLLDERYVAEFTRIQF